MLEVLVVRQLLPHHKLVAPAAVLVDLVYPLLQEVCPTQVDLAFPLRFQEHQLHMQLAEMAIPTQQQRFNQLEQPALVTVVEQDLQVAQV
jgi:hypothetical protein